MIDLDDELANTLLALAKLRAEKQLVLYDNYAKLARTEQNTSKRVKTRVGKWRQD